MPGKVFTNADVQRMLGRSPLPAEQEPVGMKMPSLGYQAVNPSTHSDIDARMSGAKAALQRAAGRGDQSGLASVPDRLRQMEEERFRPSMKDAIQATTQGMAHAGRLAGAAAMIPGPQQPFLAAINMPLMAPDILRHIIMPGDDETRLGGVAEAGFNAALSYGPGMIGKAWTNWRHPEIAQAAKAAEGQWGRLAEANSIQRATRVPGEELTDQISHEVPYQMAPSSRTPVGPPTPALEALQKPRATSGRAARDMAAYSGPDRRIDSSGKLPMGMTDRRMDELLQKFAGLPASWKPFVRAQ